MPSSNVKYIGLDVHQEAITVAVRSGAGNQERSQAPRLRPIPSDWASCYVGVGRECGPSFRSLN